MDMKREFKDSVFVKLFSEPSRLLELYNAIADTSYGEDIPIEINTLFNVIVKGLRNDISFIIDGKFVVLVEHQSSICNNMPLRFLLYITRILDRMIGSDAVFQEKLIKLPTPEFIVLYNGVKPFPQDSTFRLSDAFIATDESQEKFGGMELTVRVLNINPDGNADLLQKSGTLNGYTTFVERARHNLNCGMELSEAITEAIKWCIEHGVLSDFLLKHRSEVHDMLFTEFDIDIAKGVWQKEAFADGLAEGEAMGEARGEARGEAKRSVDIARKLLASGISNDVIISSTGLPHDEIERLRKSN
jgi:hypothetical protein